MYTDNYLKYKLIWIANVYNCYTTNLVVLIGNETSQLLIPSIIMEIQTSSYLFTVFLYRPVVSFTEGLDLTFIWPRHFVISVININI